MRYFVIALAIISFIGFLDAGYLAVEHYRGEIVPCAVLKGCEEVTTSKYATIFAVPVALYGAIYYLFIFLASVYYLDRKDRVILRFLSIFPVFGLVASVWFVYLQIFEIKAVCLYCMGSAVSSALLFLVGLRIILVDYKK